MIQNSTPKPTRTWLTEKAYIERVAKLRIQGRKETHAPDDLTLQQTVRWFSEQQFRWSASTVRQYQAALRFAVRYEYMRHVLERKEAVGLLSSLKRSPSPKPKKSVRSTSAKKRKNVPFFEFESVVSFLKSGNELDQLAGVFLECNIRIGLRPVEWQSVTLLGHILVVRCAKFTNGRGIAEYRALDLAPVIEGWCDFADVVACLQSGLRREAKAAGNWATLWSRLASRIARACRSISIRRIALYTTRHIALATAKEIMVPAAVAALAGHASDRTAGTHYARSRTGFASHLKCATPTKELLDLVRQPPRAVQQRDGKFRREGAAPVCEDALKRVQETVPASYSPR